MITYLMGSLLLSPFQVFFQYASNGNGQQFVFVLEDDAHGH